MENKKKKILLITVTILILTIIGSVGGYTIYKQNKIKARSAEVKADMILGKSSIQKKTVIEN